MHVYTHVYTQTELSQLAQYMRPPALLERIMAAGADAFSVFKRISEHADGDDRGLKAAPPTTASSTTSSSVRC